MPNTALITGASSGIGRELARLHAGKGGDLILTARREDRLKELAAELGGKGGVKVHVLPLDLAAEGAADTLWQQVQALDTPIDILVNNAGFGGLGLFVDRDLERDTQMIALNITALVRLTHHVARHMVLNRSGRILNVGSTAGMIPGPMQATYFATKAFVNSFSLALDEELRDKGVTVTVLCPGPVKTEFGEVAGFDSGSPAPGAADATRTARVGYNAMRAGQLLAVDQPMIGFALQWLAPLLPRRLILKAVKRAQSR